MDTSHAPESFRSLFLRHRRRARLIQRDLAALVGVSVQSVQDWEAGQKFPAAARLQQLIRAFLTTGGLTPGHETSEARGLWAAAEREAPRMHSPFDEQWFAQLLATSNVLNARVCKRAADPWRDSQAGNAYARERQRLG